MVLKIFKLIHIEPRASLKIIFQGKKRRRREKKTLTNKQGKLTIINDITSIKSTPVKTNLVSDQRVVSSFGQFQFEKNKPFRFDESSHWPAAFPKAFKR